MKKLFLFSLILFLLFTPKVFAIQIIPGGQIENDAIQKIENELKNRGETRRHEIIFSRAMNDIRVPNGPLEIKTSLPTTLNYAGVTPVRASIYIGGKFYRDVHFVATLKVYDSVLVAVHDLHIETPVNAGDFRLSEIAVDGRVEYVKNIEEIAGLVPHRYVRAGSPVSVNYFQTQVAVRGNSPVTIISNINGFQITAKGIALNRGRIGQIIKVKNENSQKILSAKVVDANTVEVVS